MELPHFDLNEWITIILIITQAGVVYYRLKKVEQSTERFNDLLVEFAVYKNDLENHKLEFEKHTVRIENVIDKIDSRISGIESHAYEALIKNRHKRGEL